MPSQDCPICGRAFKNLGAHLRACQKKNGAPGAVRAVAYVRVSTQEQGESGLGLAAQREKLEVEARARGWALEVRQEVASGKTLAGRPVLSTLLDDLAAQKVDVLLVAKVDRLSRSMADFAGLLDVAEKQGWAVRALDLDVDTSTPAGRLMAGVMVSVAEFERRRLSERTKEAMSVLPAETKARMSGPAGPSGKLRRRPPATNAALESRLAAWFAEGSSDYAIAKTLNADAVPTVAGGARWYPSTVKKIRARLSADAVPVR